MVIKESKVQLVASMQLLAFPKTKESQALTQMFVSTVEANSDLCEKLEAQSCALVLHLVCSFAIQE